MARKTIQDWYDIIVAEANGKTELLALQPNPDNAQTFLSDLTSTSKVKSHRFWIWVIAVCSYVLDGLFYSHKEDVDAKLAAGKFGTLPWYKAISYLFQYGDSLEWVGNEYTYSTIDELKQIIKYAEATTSGRLIQVKVAKQSGGAPLKLTAPELAAFESYIDELQPPGESVAIISNDPDLLKLEIDIVYNPQLLDSSGVLISDGATSPVDDAIDTYLNSVEFAGKFDSVVFIDMIQQAIGVVNPYIVSAEGKANAAASWTTIVRNYNPDAGYMIIDPSNPVIINYSPDV